MAPDDGSVERRWANRSVRSNCLFDLDLKPTIDTAIEELQREDINGQQGQRN